MKKILLSLLCGSFFLGAMDQKEPLYLVIGSYRNNRVIEKLPPFLKKLWKIDAYKMLAIVGHCSTFGGKATTIHPHKSNLSSKFKHIQADPAEFDFSRYDIKACFFERIPPFKTLENNDQGPLLNLKLIKNYSGETVLRLTKLETVCLSNLDYSSNCIKNVCRAMSPGAIMEIEWYCYCVDFTSTLDSIFNIPKLGEITSPFGYLLDIEKFSVLIKQCIDTPYVNPLSNTKNNKQKDEKTEKYKKTVLALINFYNMEGLGKKSDLKNRLQDELEIFENNETKNCKIEKCLGEGESNDRLLEVYPYDYFLLFLASDLFIIHHSGHAKKFIENCGFTNITIERRKNTHNGLENVWMITATKV